LSARAAPVLAEQPSAVYKYTFPIEPSQAFSGRDDRQTGGYWLSVQAQLIHAPGTTATRFGWKTSLQTWNDVAVWAQAEERTRARGIDSYTLGRTLCVTADGPGLSDRHVKPEPIRGDTSGGGRLLCTEPEPVVAAVWWGSYIGYTDQACGCNT